MNKKNKVEWMTIGWNEIIFKIPREYNHQLVGQVETLIKHEKKDILDKVDKFIKERTSVKSSGEGTNVSLVKFMPFEWEDFKKEILKKC